ncbi:type IV pili methyl-accepting chemotaxis transducer N-terminal domain-containing protein [Neisseriaceae bacterium TC5R-5]|nr:type IV pili methyl-accepting chemotaxis transducer N-terminal domain-containing protein [Neisseriaceae bacterium TC5R-5]
MSLPFHEQPPVAATALPLKSLSSKLLALTILWLLLAMTSIGYTLILSWQQEGGAAAINDAGSLRMRSYRLALLLNQQSPPVAIAAEQRRFENTLARLLHGDPARPLFLPDKLEVHAQARDIVQQWRQHILPLLATSSPSTLPTGQLEKLVNSIDQLVWLIEEDNAHNTRLLRLFQMALMVMAVVGAMLMMYLLFLLVIRPLKALGTGIAQIHDGELSARVAVVGNDEFAHLSAGFNQMAERLQELYGTLEEKVQQKTRSLDEKNRQLTALFSVTAFLHESQQLEPMCAGFIERLVALTQADAASIRLVDRQRGKLEPLAQQGLPEEMSKSYDCTHIDSCYCGAALEQELTVIRLFPQRSDGVTVQHCVRAGFADVFLFHIRLNQQNIGLFTLYFRQPRTFAAAEQLLIETLCKQLGVAIQNLRLAARDRQFAVSEERNLLAQGLHDSIAQSLSFLNLQVQMLESELQDSHNDTVQQTLTFIKTGVQECYEDVRELLLNFRTRLNKEDFPETVHKLLQRFEQQAQVLTQCQIRGEGLPLSPEQELQVIFILQEALSNVRKHAQAQRVEIDIENREDFVMRIRDDGCGFDLTRLALLPSCHVGLAIMQERAARIQARIEFAQADKGGTSITLTLPHTERHVA